MLPASAALIVHGTCMSLGRRVVDRIDVRVGQQLFIRAVSLRNAYRGRGLLRLRQVPRCNGNDLAQRPCCIPGITFFRPMFAVLRTPQRILLDIIVNHKAPILRRDKRSQIIYICARINYREGNNP